MQRSKSLECNLQGALWRPPSACCICLCGYRSGGCAQAAALAEFRADWATAVKTYQTAYAELCRAPRAGVAPLQRWAELCAVAELVHLKARADPRTLGAVLRF